MKVLYKHFINILLLLWMTCFYTRPVSSVEKNYIQSTWRAEQKKQVVKVEHTVFIDSGLSSLIRGLPSIDPTQLGIALAKFGAMKSQCQVNDDDQTINIHCTYEYPITSQVKSSIQTFPIPSLELLHFIRGVPAETAKGFIIETFGELVLEGYVYRLPLNEDNYFENGSMHTRSFTLTSLHSLEVYAQDLLAPGEVSMEKFNISKHLQVLSKYNPEPIAWIAYISALVSIFLIVKKLFPIHKFELFQIEHIRSIRKRDWFSKIWPAFFNGFTGLLFEFLGGSSIMMSLKLIEAIDWLTLLQAFLEWIVQQFRISINFQILQWPGWPVLLFLFALTLLAIGLGLWFKKDIARQSAATLVLLLFGFLAGFWAHLILLPPLFPFQLGIVFILGEMALIFLASVYRLLTHPQVRAYYMLEE